MKTLITLTLTVASAALLTGLAATARAEDGAAIFQKHCVSCHGKDGQGNTKAGIRAGVKDFTDAKFQASFSDEQAFKAIKEGIKDGQKTKMKPAEGVTDAEIKLLVAYVRGFKK
jgi:mono/diheme cytochrome c family protein